MKLRQDYRNLWHSDLMGTVTADTPCKKIASCLACVDLVFHTYFVKEHYTMTCQGILVVLDICLVVEGVEKANALNFALLPRFSSVSETLASTRFLLQDEFNIQTTQCDNCIIGFMFCLSQVACIFSIVACLVGSDEFSEASQILSCCADMVYCTVCACMQTQHKLEMDKRDGVFGSQPMGVPPAQQMSRFDQPVPPPVGYPPASYPQAQGYPPASYPPAQGYPPASYPPPGYPQH